jgi:hypothetical protein
MVMWLWCCGAVCWLPDQAGLLAMWAACMAADLHCARSCPVAVMYWILA